MLWAIGPHAFFVACRHYAAFATAQYAARHAIPVHFLGGESELDTTADELLQLDAETLRGMAAFD